jgi:hypothetical protein
VSDLYTLSFPQLVLVDDEPIYLHNVIGTLAGIGTKMIDSVTSIGVVASVIDTCKSITCSGDTMTVLNGYHVPENSQAVIDKRSTTVHSHALGSTNAYNASIRRTKAKGEIIQLATPTARRRNFLCCNTQRNHPHENHDHIMNLSGWYKREKANTEDAGLLPSMPDGTTRVMYMEFDNSDHIPGHGLLQIVDNDELLRRRLIDIRQSTLILSIKQLQGISEASTPKFCNLPLAVKSKERIDGVYIIPPSTHNEAWTLVHAWKEECSHDEATVLTSSLRGAVADDRLNYANTHTGTIHLGHLVTMGSMIFDHTEIIKAKEEDIASVIINMFQDADDTITLGDINHDPGLVSFTSSMPPLLSPIPKDEPSPVRLTVINPTEKRASNEMLKMYIANSGASTANLDARDECIARLTEISNDNPIGDAIGWHTPCMMMDLSERADKAPDDVSAASDVNILAGTLARASYGVVCPNDNGAMQNLKDLSKLGTDGKHKPIPAFGLFAINNILSNDTPPATHVDIDGAGAATTSKALTGLTFVVFGRYKGVSGFISQAQLKGAVVKSGGTVYKRSEVIKSLTDPDVDGVKCIKGMSPSDYDPIYTMDDFYGEVLKNPYEDRHIIKLNSEGFKGFTIIVVNDKKLAKKINDYTKYVNKRIIENYVAASQPKFNNEERIGTYVMPEDNTITTGIDFMYHCLAAMTPDVVLGISDGTIKIEDVLPTVMAPKNLDYERYATLVPLYRKLHNNTESNNINTSSEAKSLQADIVSGLRHVFSI